MATSIVVVVFVAVAASVMASAYSDVVRSSPDLGGGWWDVGGFVVWQRDTGDSSENS